MLKDKVYSAAVWAQLVKKDYQYACAKCGSLDDVQAVHLTPPSLGGRNILSNGTTACLQCRSKNMMEETRVRFNFSIPENLFDRLDKYCQKSGRSINDVVKQILADFLFDKDYHLNGFHKNGEYKNDRRVSVPIRKSVFDLFTRKCIEVETTHTVAVKSLLYRYLESFERS